MKVYISCHHRDPANELAAILVAAGHEVVSTWHTSTEPRPAANDAEAWRQKADRNFAEIETAGALVVIASTEHLSRERCVLGGKFVEAGYALNQRCKYGDPYIRVLTLGGVENGMLYTSDVEHAKDTDELLAMLAN